jgi:hypothetical protein
VTGRPRSRPGPLSLSRLAAEGLAMEAQAAQEAGELGYMARLLVQATMPHSNPNTLRVERSNGLVTLRMTATGDGLPYGGIPRLLLAWVTTEAVRTRERTVTLGPTLSGFMAQLDLVPTGGRWGTIPRLRGQMRRLFTSVVSATYDNRPEGRWDYTAIPVADQVHDFWDPQRPDQAALWESTVTLGERFFLEILERPVPVDMRALRALKRSPLALDLYTWLTYRMSYLRAPTAIPWEALHAQFGADYGLIRHFRAEVRRALGAVAMVYPEARVDASSASAIRLVPSPPHITAAAQLSLL